LTWSTFALLKKQNSLSWMAALLIGLEVRNTFSIKKLILGDISAYHPDGAVIIAGCALNPVGGNSSHPLKIPLLPKLCKLFLGLFRPL
jgi:hypothetical protein